MQSAHLLQRLENAVHSGGGSLEVLVPRDGALWLETLDVVNSRDGDVSVEVGTVRAGVGRAGAGS